MEEKGHCIKGSYISTEGSIIEVWTSIMKAYIQEGKIKLTNTLLTTNTLKHCQLMQRWGDFAEPRSQIQVQIHFVFLWQSSEYITKIWSITKSSLLFCILYPFFHFSTVSGILFSNTMARCSLSLSLQDFVFNTQLWICHSQFCYLLAETLTLWAHCIMDRMSFPVSPVDRNW